MRNAKNGAYLPADNSRFNLVAPGEYEFSQGPASVTDLVKERLKTFVTEKPATAMTIGLIAGATLVWVMRRRR